MRSKKASQTREAHLLHASATVPLGPRGEDAEGGWGRIHVAVGFFPLLLTVRDFFCPFKQIRRRWPICASRIRGTLCLKMVHHFMGIESHVWICGTYRSGAPHDFWRNTEQEGKTRKHSSSPKQEAHRSSQWTDYLRQCAPQSTLRCDGRKNHLIQETISFYNHPHLQPSPSALLHDFVALDLGLKPKAHVNISRCVLMKQKRAVMDIYCELNSRIILKIWIGVFLPL